MRIDRRKFVTMAGAAVPLAVSSSGAGAAIKGKGLDNGDDDATDAINLALERHSEVVIPEGEYRVDGTITVPRHTRLTLAYGAILRRYARQSDSDEPLVRVIGNRASLIGGRIITENSHPRGIVTLGHADAEKRTRYNATDWNFADCSLQGRQEKGNVAVWIPNSQASHQSTDYANYFGHVQNISIRRADIGVLLDEVSNAHRFYGITFSHLISSAWELRGAYANQVFGGFLHQSENGIVAIRLRNTKNNRYHDSIYNSFIGFGIEPGGDRSAAYEIDSRCRRNTLIIQSNVAGKSIDHNGENFISRHGGSWPDADSIF